MGLLRPVGFVPAVYRRATAENAESAERKERRAKAGSCEGAMALFRRFCRGGEAGDTHKLGDAYPDGAGKLVGGTPRDGRKQGQAPRRGDAWAAEAVPNGMKISVSVVPDGT